MFDRQIFAISPFTPRSEIIPHVRIADQPQCEISMCGTIGTLTVRNDFLVGSDTALSVHLRQLIGGFEETLFVQIVCPFQMNRTRDGTAAFCSNEFAGVFGIAPGIDDDG